MLVSGQKPWRFQVIYHRAFHAFFRRVQGGEKPGYPRFQRGHRYHSFTHKQFGNGATLDDGFLVLSKTGRMGVRWSRPLQGTPKTVAITHEADGWYVCFACEGVPVQPLPPTGQETGIDVGLKAVLVTADGKVHGQPAGLICVLCRRVMSHKMNSLLP